MGCVETKGEDEAVAMAVATAWCEKNGMRPPAGVRRWILADERILGVEAVAEEPVGAGAGKKGK